MHPAIPFLARRASALLLAAALAGCADDPARDQVASASTALPCGSDWNLAGFDDAAAGRPPERGLMRLAQCRPDPEARLAQEDAYLAGHDQGRVAYCGPESARDLARRRIRPSLECPPQMQEAFDAAYAQGLSEPAQSGPYRPDWRLRPSLTVGVGSGGTRTSWGLGITF